MLGGVDIDEEWAEKIKEIHKLLGSEKTYKEAITKLIAFRGKMFKQISQIVNSYPNDAFYQMPFMNVKGYHSKTLSYSIWHIFRIEDIVSHELIAKDDQILFRDDFQRRIGAPILTTGNELEGEDIADFSRLLNVKELLSYSRAVMEATNEILNNLEYKDFKIKFTSEDEQRLKKTECVSDDENSAWLILYWCSKDVRGLIKMPFSRHWVMHIEAMRRIKNKLCKDARKGVDPVAYCGFSCNHCFLSAWCGSCRTEYNVCSFATCSQDGVCPNVACCKRKGYDGCYECADLENCEIGFYISTNDGANAAKAQAMYIRKHGKKALLKVQERLHEKYEFSKTQEILGQDIYKGLKILEDNKN